MFATAFHTSRHYILFTVMACLCVFLGGPSYAAGTESLFIAGATYYEPGVSGPGWAWTDADHLNLTGYSGEAIGADGDLVVTLVGQNSVVETHAPDADISMSGMEVWGDLTLRGSGSLTATGSQCGIHVSQALVVDGCTVDARADGAGVLDQTVAGIAAGSLTVRGGGRVVAAGAGSDAGLRFYGVHLLDEGFGADVASETLVVDASWLDATGTDAGVACDRGSLAAAHFVTPAGGAFGAACVVDAEGPWHRTWSLSPLAPPPRRGRLSRPAARGRGMARASLLAVPTLLRGRRRIRRGHPRLRRPRQRLPKQQSPRRPGPNPLRQQHRRFPRPTTAT